MRVLAVSAPWFQVEVPKYDCWATFYMIPEVFSNELRLTRWVTEPLQVNACDLHARVDSALSFTAAMLTIHACADFLSGNAAAYRDVEGVCAFTQYHLVHHHVAVESRLRTFASTRRASK